MADRTVVAIDGPAGSGKTTVARLAAERLGYRFLDSGALYRALALAALEAGLEEELVDGVPVGEGAARALAELTDRSRIEFLEDSVLLDGRDVSAEIRTPEVSRFVSRVAAVPEVRAGMVRKQREAWPGQDLVVEGRDIGSVVFPDAEVKIFLTARPEERARRRADETGRPFEEVLGDQEERDRRDSDRAVAPLKRAEGAEDLDTTGLSIEEVVDEIVRRVEREPGP